jgi:DUF917 family protein
MKQLTPTDLRHYVRGADVLARGSGSATPFMDAVQRGECEAPMLASASELSGHIVTVVKFGATGTTHDWTPFCREALDRLLQDSGLGWNDLAGFTGVEINRSQMDRTLGLCAALGRPLVDGDHVGATAVPSLALCRSVPAGVSLRTSFVVVDASSGSLQRGAHGITDEGTGFQYAAEIDTRLRACTGQGGVAAALFLTRDTSVLHHGSVSHTIALGGVLDEPDPVAGLLRYTGGRRLGSGILREVRKHPGVGFTARTLVVDDLIVTVMNEFLSVERGGDILAAVPQHIAVVDDNGTGVLTAQADQFLGKQLHLIEIPLVEPPTADICAEWARIMDIYREWSQQIDSSLRPRTQNS